MLQNERAELCRLLRRSVAEVSGSMLSYPAIFENAVRSHIADFARSAAMIDRHLDDIKQRSAALVDYLRREKASPDEEAVSRLKADLLAAIDRYEAAGKSRRY